MNDFPKELQQLIYRYLFESDFGIVRSQLLAETSSIASMLNDGNIQEIYCIKNCTFCTSAWVCQLDVIMYTTVMCDLCVSDLYKSDVYNPPSRVYKWQER